MKVMRLTKQKKVILDVLRSTKSHPTADWIYEQAKKELPNISLGTIYRNLNVLKDMGEILELNYGSSQSHFDGNPENHYHFVCEDCGKVYDIEIPLNEDINTQAYKETGFLIKGHRLEFYGTCNVCQNHN